MDWNKFARDVHEVAVKNGLWDKPRTFDDIVCECLVHLGRAYDEYRSGRPNYYHLCQPSGEKNLPCDMDLGEFCPVYHKNPCEHRERQPHGAAAELGECVLRLLDYCAFKEWSVHNGTLYNAGFADLLCTVVVKLSGASCRMFSEEWRASCLDDAISMIFSWCWLDDVDMESILQELHEHNKARAERREGAEAP